MRKIDIVLWGIRLFVLLIVMVLLVFMISLIYRGYDYWTWIGSPSQSKIITCLSDNYPGHSIECIKFDDIEDEEFECVYDDIGEGIDVDGISIHIGDSKSHIQHELRYGDLREDEYVISCHLCHAFGYVFRFEYDDNDVLVKMTVEVVE